jgi:hypothetical protein
MRSIARFGQRLGIAAGLRWEVNMIRFACPVCSAVCAAPPEAVGKKASCPKCGQRLQVPAPRRPSVLGKPLPDTPIPITEEITSELASVSPASTEEDEAPAPSRYSRKILVILALCFFGMLCFCLLPPLFFARMKTEGKGKLSGDKPIVRKNDRTGPAKPAT